MYSNIKSVQILISLMKEFGINHVILSPGGSDIPIIHSIETDNYFQCYSVVDERSAVYYAMGMAQQLQQPVTCVCTSGTAVCNYLPGITEAFYQDVPVLAVTADKNPYYQDQLETQKIKQNGIFKDVVKKSVELPIVESSEDAWLCNRLVNEAMLELTHRGAGPVQINIPIVGETNIYDCEVLPKQRKMTYISKPNWGELASQLSNKKVMVVVGQNINFTENDIENMEVFFECYDCIYAVENLSNLCCKGIVNTYATTEMRPMSDLDYLCPEIVISIGNNLSSYQLKPFLRSHYKSMENWLISESGVVRDAYKCLTNIVEVSPSTFFSGIISASIVKKHSDHLYYNLWLDEINKINLPDFEFSNFYVAKRLAEIMPENSILHTAILNSTRVMQFFPIAKGIKVYSNVGALGIDGCFSTFVGQAAVNNSLSYLLIGDLSFFYDMNAAGLKSINRNVRVILLNNGGGSEFHFFMGKRNIPEIDSYICAEHEKIATGWIISLGYDYYTVTTKEEFEEVIEKFGLPSEKPLFLEVLGNMEAEAERTNAFYDLYRKMGISNKRVVKKIIGNMLPERKKQKVKKILQILKES